MNKKSRLRLTSWLLAVVMAISIASPALAADASVVSESTPAAVSESTPDNSVPESIPAQGNDVPTSTDPPEENQGAADSSSEPKSESTPESENIPDSTSASDSESTPDSSSVPESESMSDSDSASGSESTPDSESDSLSESTSSTESGSETPAFTPLGIAEMFTHAEAQPGDTVELYVRLNRDDVAATYQWQVLDASPGEIESPEAMYPYGEGESTDYAFLLDGMTEEELLAINPDAVWPGIEMYYAKKGKQARQRTLSSEPIHIENGTPNYVLNPEAQDIEDTITHILLDGVVEGDDVIVAQDSIAGTYESSNAGETLTPDGTAQENAENKLLEYKITRTGEISLDNNPYGDYEIKAEQYSGAIRRRTISAFVGNLTARYGDGVAEEPTAAAEYSAAEGGSGTQLQISALVADDTLTLDADKSGFEYAPITAETEAGYYPLEYVGLTEENYPVLRNYIIWYEPGSIAVTPRPLVISAGEYSMIYGDPLPEFAPAYNGFINGDTPDSDLQGEPVFVTDATSTSDVGRYPVELSGLTPKPNANGADNYVVYLQPGTLDINRRPIIIEPDPDPDPDPSPVPELRRVKTEKEADREAAAVGDIITYKITVTNIGSVELKDIPVRDTNDGAGRITAADGPGYTWNEDSGTWTIHRLPVGKSITITYTYEVVEADDGKDITNVAVTTVPGTNPEDPNNPGHGIDPEKPIDPDAEYPSDEVVVPVDPDREPDPDPDPVDGRSITIVKFTDTAFAAVGDTIGYGATVTNNGTVDLTNIRLEDVFANASGPITPVEGDGYVWEDGDALIPELAVGESVTVYFDYTVQADDAGKNLRNVVIASVPGENPPDPDAPDTGVNDPDAPVTPDVEYPSNEVVVPVDPAGGGVAADPKVKIYGDADPELTYTLTEELIKPDDIWGELERVPGETVGVYPILQGTLESKNYDITYVPAIFRILPAPLTVTAQDKTKVYGAPNPKLTYTVTGWKLDDTLENATNNDVQLDTPVGLYTLVGEYPITPSGLTLPLNAQGKVNYDVQYVPGVFRVLPITGLIDVFAPEAEAIVRGPDGNILTVTPKQFPKTGVTPSDVTEHEDGTLTAEFKGDSAPDEITYNGKTYSRTGEVTIDRADGAPKEPESVVVEYSGLEEQQVPQTYHVDNGSRSYDLSLSDVQFAAGAPQTLTIDYTDTATPTPPQVYVAEIDGVETTFTLASMEQTSDYSWRDVDFTTVWYGRQLADFYLGKIQPDSPAIPFDSANPRYAGYEAVLLQYLGLDADTYRIVDSEWRQLDEPWQNTLRHTGVYHAQRYAASWRATYTTASGTYDAVATYSALAEEAPAIATADYAEVRAAPASVLPIVVLSCLGALLVALVIVLVLVILKKRHRDSGESKQ